MKGAASGRATDTDAEKVTIRWSFREEYQVTMSKRDLARLLPPEIDPDNQPAVWAWLERFPDVLEDFSDELNWLDRDEGSLELHEVSPVAGARGEDG